MDPSSAKPYKSLIAALDIERESDTPVITGLRISSENAAELHLVAAVRPELLLAKGFFDAQIVERDVLLKDARNALVSRLNALTERQIDTNVIVGEPADVIAHVAEIRSGDLIVIGARKRRNMERLFGTTTTDVLRAAEGVDVYACHREDPQNKVERVVVAIDGSEVTEDVLSRSAQVVTDADIDPHNVRVVCVTSKSKDEMVKRSHQFLAKSKWQTMEIVPELESVPNTLDSFVRDFDADLLIIGSGKNRGVGWAIGSTSNSILHEVSCDCLMIRPR